MRLTPWFPGAEVPERIGVYERRRSNTDAYSYFSQWDGRQWWPAGLTPDEAVLEYMRYRNLGVPKWVSQVWYWRGVHT